MTILSVAQQIATYTGRDIPTSLVAATDRDSIELSEVLQEGVEAIVQSHDWEVLKLLHTYAGDGTTETFSLPSNYARMPKEQKLWSTRIETPLTHIPDQDRWLELDIRSYEFVIGVWTKLGGQILIKPAPVVGENVQFYYIRNDAIVAADNSRLSSITADTDTFVLSERLLKLYGVWRWKAKKGQPFETDLRAYETALGEYISDDKGSTRIRIGRARIRKDVNVSYPQAIQT